jgi:hypothetical protein
MLKWGGKNLKADCSPVDAGLVPELGANRLAFFPKTKVVLEYSLDTGSTWTTLDSDDIKASLFATGSKPFYIGNSSANKITKTDYQCRVTLTTTGACYSVLRKFAIYISTAGSTGSYCTIEARTKAN